jgi:hypothetical protein
MHTVLLFSLPIACAAGLLFSGYRRHARRQRDLQILRDRIMFGISAGSWTRRKEGRMKQPDSRGAVIREN